MATKNFTIRTTAIDPDSNEITESVQVKAGPASCSAPVVTTNYPDVLNVSEGNSVNPFWGVGTFQTIALIEVQPRVTDGAGGTGGHLVQFYYDSGNYPNSPDRRFHTTFEGVGGQLATALEIDDTSFMVVTSGTGIQSSGLADQTDLTALRKAIFLTGTAVLASETSDERGEDSSGEEREVAESRRRLVTLPGLFDEQFTIYHHDLTTNRVYTLGRKNVNDRKGWLTGSSVNFHPYNYTPVYANATGAPVNFNPHVLVSEEGTQFTLTGRFTVSGTYVSGTFADLQNEISGTNKVIKFTDSLTWYILSGVTSQGELTIYDYGDALYLTNQVAQVNCFTKTSGLIQVNDNVTGCGNWTVAISPDYDDQDRVPSLTVNYQADIVELVAGANISGTPQYEWQEYVNSAWSGLVPGNLATQTVTYTEDVAKRIRVRVSGTGLPSCVAIDDTGDLALKEEGSAGTWTARAGFTTVFAAAEPRSITVFQGLSPRVDGKYYHHNMYIMEPQTTNTTSTVRRHSSTINVTAGTIDTFPENGLVLIRDPDPSSNKFAKYAYNGKTNNSLLNVEFAGSWLQLGSTPSNRDLNRQIFTSMGTGSTLSTFTQHHPPWTWIVSRLDSRRVKVQNARALVCKGAANRYVRIGFGTLELESDGGDQARRLASVNVDTNEVEFEQSLPAWVQGGNAMWIDWWANIDGMREGPSGPDSWNRYNMSFYLYRRANATDRAAPYIFSETETHRITLTDPVNINAVYTGIFDLSFKDINAGRFVIPVYGDTPIVLESIGHVVRRGYVGEHDLTIKRVASNQGFSSLRNSPQYMDGEFKLRQDLSIRDGRTSRLLPNRALMLPYWDGNVRFYGVAIFSPDADESIDLELNQDDFEVYPGYSYEWFDQVFKTDSASEFRTTALPTTVPRNIQYTDVWEHALTGYPGFGSLSSHGPVFYQNDDAILDGPVFCIKEDQFTTILDDQGFEGSIPIGDIKPQDKVATSAGYSSVIKVQESFHANWIKLEFEDGGTLECTGEHPVSVGNTWIKAGDLSEGDQVNGRDKRKFKLIKKHAMGSTKKMRFINLQVMQPKNFYVNGVLVHNKSFAFWT